MKIKITADSACDLGNELCERYNISIMPLKVILGDKTYFDGVDIQPQDIFDYVKQTDNLPKTAAGTCEEAKQFFEKNLEGYDAIIHFDITSKASSSYDNACVAAKEFNGKVFVVDTLALSTGQGLLVLKACDLAAEGKSPEEIVSIIESLRPKVNTSFVPDALDYLHKGGRCSLAALMGAKVLKLHPMIDIKDGQMYAKKKYMGNMDRCIRRYVEELAEDYPEYDTTRCFITHSSCSPDFVEKVRQMVKELFRFDEVLETVAGNVVTSHCGQGTLGVLFISK
jgi:DegV family protein with EDD domain